MDTQYLWIKTKDMNSKEVREWVKQWDSASEDELEAVQKIIKAKEYREEKFMNDWGND